MDKRKYAKLIWRIDRCSEKTLMRILEEYGIGPGQIHYIMRLYDQDGITQNELTVEFNTGKATSSRAINALLEKGFVTAETDENDRRSKKIFLSEKALSIKDELFSKMGMWSDSLTHGFADSEKDLLYDYLTRMVVNAEKEYERRTHNE